MNVLPSNLENVKIKNVLMGPGCTILDSGISDSIIGSRSIIGKGCNITESILMGADYFEAEKHFIKPTSPTFPPVGIGARTTIHKAIIDKNARIGADCQLTNREGVFESYDRIKSGICIRDGVLVVSKSSAVPDGTVV